MAMIYFLASSGIGGKPGISPAQTTKHLKPLTTLVEEQATKVTSVQRNLDYEVR